MPKYHVSLYQIVQEYTKFITLISLLKLFFWSSLECKEPGTSCHFLRIAAASLDIQSKKKPSMISLNDIYLHYEWMSKGQEHLPTQR